MVSRKILIALGVFAVLAIGIGSVLWLTTLRPTGEGRPRANICPLKR